MSLLTVDQEKCKRDGICAEVCPVGIIELKDKDAFPSLVDGGDKLCIRLWTLCRRLSTRCHVSHNYETRRLPISK